MMRMKLKHNKTNNKRYDVQESEEDDVKETGQELEISKKKRLFEKYQQDENRRLLEKTLLDECHPD